MIFFTHSQELFLLLLQIKSLKNLLLNSLFLKLFLDHQGNLLHFSQPFAINVLNSHHGPLVAQPLLSQTLLKLDLLLDSSFLFLLLSSQFLLLSNELEIIQG